MPTAIDLSHIYQSRNNFTIIGLTGRSGSGCSQVAIQLSKGFGDGSAFENPFSPEFKNTSGFKHNSYRKYRIVHEYGRINFLPYTLIKYRHVLTLFLLQYRFEDFVEFLSSPVLEKGFSDSKFTLQPDFSEELNALQELKGLFNELSEEYRQIDIRNLATNSRWDQCFNFFFKGRFQEFSEKVHDVMKSKSLLKRNKTLQIIANNLRKSGHPFRDDDLTAKNIDTIVELINDLIKSHRKIVKERTHVVIDSLRNPFEIMFFKQRFSAFYTIAVHKEDESRKYSVVEKNSLDNSLYGKDLEALLKEEYKGGEDYEFFKQKVEACIQQADIHLSFLTTAEAFKINFEREEQKQANPLLTDNTTPFFSWKMQLLKYVSLISHPGLVTPSPEERCMQLAYTAKHNSGCISRHVGAAITDENYSIKAIGWNNTPEGQVPCVLRNAEDLLNHYPDLDAFTPYERGDADFKQVLSEHYESQIQQNRDKLKGRNVCFCFKSLKNCYSEGKNQVHTRSLHAEESAFLQLAKYGGVGIEGGKLFTTASPCELCAKKAYQLGIQVIYYIDPYPGISNKQILDAGTNPIEVRLFNGAIGNAYHWLYDPIMPYKDELALLLGQEIKDLTGKYEKKIADQEKEIASLRKQLSETPNNN